MMMTQTARPKDIEHILSEIREKRVWIRKEDKLKLCEKYSMCYAALNRQLLGKIKRINVAMIAEALDIINKNESAITSRLDN